MKNKVMDILFFSQLIFFTTGCEEESKCASSQDVTYVNEVSDFTYEGEFDVSGYPNGIVRIEVWDCVDASWWGPVDEQKIIQVFSNPNDCGSYDDIEQMIFDCDDQSTLEKFVRDDDGDGIVRANDCDDTDSSIGICEEATDVE